MNYLETCNKIVKLCASTDARISKNNSMIFIDIPEVISIDDVEFRNNKKVILLFKQNKSIYKKTDRMFSEYNNITNVIGNNRAYLSSEKKFNGLKKQTSSKFNIKDMAKKKNLKSKNVIFTNNNYVKQISKLIANVLCKNEVITEIVVTINNINVEDLPIKGNINVRFLNNVFMEFKEYDFIMENPILQNDIVAFFKTFKTLIGKFAKQSNNEKLLNLIKEKNYDKLIYSMTTTECNDQKFLSELLNNYITAQSDVFTIRRDKNKLTFS